MLAVKLVFKYVLCCYASNYSMPKVIAAVHWAEIFCTAASVVKFHFNFFGLKDFMKYVTKYLEHFTMFLSK